MKTKINVFYIQNANEALLAFQDSKFEHLAVKTVSQEGQSLAFHILGLRHDTYSHSCYTLMDPPSHYLHISFTYKNSRCVSILAIGIFTCQLHRHQDTSHLCYIFKQYSATMKLQDSLNHKIKKKKVSSAITH